MSGQERDSATFGAIMKKRMTDPEGAAVSSSARLGPSGETDAATFSPLDVLSTSTLAPDRTTGDTLVPFNTRLSPLIYRELKLFCVEHDVKQQVVIAEALKDYFLARKKI